MRYTEHTAKNTNAWKTLAYSIVTIFQSLFAAQWHRPECNSTKSPDSKIQR